MSTKPTGLPPVPERYEVLGEVATTPFERTLHARDRVLGRDVLLKLPAAAALASWSVSVRDRLLREARALASVRHEAVLPILNVEETGAGPMLVLDLPEGELLADRLRLGPLEIDAARDLAIDVAEALGALHYASFVHRAVSAEAVYVRTDGHARLGAFTFAKEFGGHGASSIDYRAGGDARAPRCMPAYPAPEQLQGQAADPRCDVFALGCLLYRCLSGQEPNGAETGEVAELRSLRPEVSKDLAEVVRRCMALARAARYPTAQAVADALKATRPVGAKTPGSVAARRAQVVVLGLCAVFLTCGLYVWLQPHQEDAGRSPGPVDPDPAKTYADTYAKCHALLVGIDAYHEPWPPLPNAARDVAAIADQLKQNDPRWAVRLLPAAEATHKQILAEMKLLCDPQRVGPEDAVLFYFAGHGHRPERASEQYWLVGVNAQSKDAEGEPGFVNSPSIRDFLKLCPAKHVLVVLDTCFGARVFGSSRGEVLGDTPRSTGGPRDPLLRRAARQFLVSAGKDRPAADGKGQLSPFCKAFLDAITPRGKEPLAVSSRSIRQSIEDAMRGNDAGLQVPAMMEYTEPEGCFVFFVPAKKP